MRFCLTSHWAARRTKRARRQPNNVSTLGAHRFGQPNSAWAPGEAYLYLSVTSRLGSLRPRIIAIPREGYLRRFGYWEAPLRGQLRRIAPCDCGIPCAARASLNRHRRRPAGSACAKIWELRPKGRQGAARREPVTPTQYSKLLARLLQKRRDGAWRLPPWRKNTRRSSSSPELAAATLTA